MWKADSLPSFYSDGDNQEDAGREWKVTAALKEGEDKVYDTITEAKMEGQDKKIIQKKDVISNAETWQKMIEEVGQWTWTWNYTFINLFHF